MRIAVTGPTGAIGSDLIRLALSKGHDVVAIVRPNSKNISNLPVSDNLKIVFSDVSEYSKISADCNCDIFFHLAWMETFGGKRDDVDVQCDNIRYSLDAVKLAHSWGSKVFVGTGSQAEYGPCSMKLGKDTPTNPESGYGIAKYAAGKLCKLLCSQLGIRFNWARIISVYGDHDADHTLIMYLIKTMLSGNSPKLTSCDQIWDYTYSKDVASALLLIGEKGVDGKSYPIGTGKPRRLKDYISVIRDLIDPSIELEFGAIPYYPHQPMMLCGDISELTEDTGFVPEYEFENGIANVLNFVRNCGLETNSDKHR
ncbi:NAD-dependent epimerase/dehydratase family protein [Methanomethylophilus alvi]|uniref:NAD-dependent epimerase/dehydratase family protein n=1 Tax=Methanomethylophilus alvi TaxID=1291540 RepID=UPI0037DBFD90